MCLKISKIINEASVSSIADIVMKKLADVYIFESTCMPGDTIPQLRQSRKQPKEEDLAILTNEEPFFIKLRSTAQKIKVTRHKTKQRTTSRDKHTDKNDREASWEKDGSSSATYHRKEKAADCNRYKGRFSE
ncbi:hypothetical protein AVEN_44836-1 [Araneus ventricosus]|uniref:Uncharacterized protein n=1 Tax=Araneus ventricosus TaxID=182803 RepID=A0A4Y2CKL1_ARAVE|nr:hypothetical protein AVEN_44836-1 [Araneus ventricosus]